MHIKVECYRGFLTHWSPHQARCSSPFSPTTLFSIKLTCMWSVDVLPLHTVKGQPSRPLSPLIFFKCISPSSSSAVSRARAVTSLGSPPIPTLSTLEQCWLQGGGSMLAKPADSHSYLGDFVGCLGPNEWCLYPGFWSSWCCPCLTPSSP